MKKYIIFAITIVISISFNTSCMNLETMNVDPNNPTTTEPSLLLTDIAYNAFSETSTDPYYATRMLVETDGENTYQWYKWDRGSFDYYDQLRDVTKMIELSKTNSEPAYKALGLFFRAHYFYKLTMNFGDIPYSDALKGESASNFKPTYDTQEKVFTGILNELDSANTILKQNSSAIISGDIVYNGNLTKWRKLINAYRLRILMTLSGKTTVGGTNIASKFASIVNSEPLMASNDDNGQMVFLDQADNRYPYYNSSSFGSGMYMDGTYISLLTSLKDPRLFAKATQTPNAATAAKAINDFTAYDGCDPIISVSDAYAKALAGNSSKPQTRYYKSATNEPMILLGYPEQQLILAEAVVRGWITGDDKSYYETAVKASFKFDETYATDFSSYLSVDAATSYLSGDGVSYSSSLSTDQKLERIGVQKYIPTFLQGNMWLAYYECLRIGYPQLAHASGTTLPYRFMYPSSELTNNTTNVQAAITSQFGGNDAISQKTWWLK